MQQDHDSLQSELELRDFSRQPHEQYLRFCVGSIIKRSDLTGQPEFD